MPNKTPGIYRQGKNSWALVLNSGEVDPATGRYRQKWVTFTGTKQEAAKERTRLLRERDTGVLVADPTDWTVSEYLNYWLATYADTHTDVKTATTYRGIVTARIVPLLGNLPLVKLTPAHLQAAYTKLLKEGRPGGKPLSARSVLHTHRVLREALHHAVKLQLLARNVAEAVDPPKPKGKEMATWTAEEARRFLVVVTERTEDGDEIITYSTALALALETGARQGEVLGLRWQDVDFEQATIGITQTVKRVHKQGIVIGKPKTPRSRRRIDLAPETLDLLRAHRARQNVGRLKLGAAYQDHGLVFATPLGTPIDTSTLIRCFHRAIKAAGVPRIRFHDLRHTHATLLLAQNEHPKVVSERLGHATIAITLDTYSHAVPGMQKAAALRLSNLLRGATSAGSRRAES